MDSVRYTILHINCQVNVNVSAGKFTISLVFPMNIGSACCHLDVIIVYFIYRFEADNGNLTLPDVGIDLEGNYTCYGQYENQTVSTSTTLVVYGKFDLIRIQHK